MIDCQGSMRGGGVRWHDILRGVDPAPSFKILVISIGQMF